MVLFENGTYMMDTQYPDTDFTDGEAVYVVPDNSELAGKVQSLGIVDFILDDDGKLIDVEAKTDPAEEIKAQLSAIDMATIRPLRAILVGKYTYDDKDKLAALEAEAVGLRAALGQIKEE